MKRLFQVMDSNKNKIVEYFEHKADAKVLRNTLNPIRVDDFVEGTKERYFIAKGPDHRKFS